MKKFIFGITVAVIGLSLVGGSMAMAQSQSETSVSAKQGQGRLVNVRSLSPSVADFEQSLSIKQTSRRVAGCLAIGCAPGGEVVVNEVLMRGAKVISVGEERVKVVIFGQDYIVDISGAIRVLNELWNDSDIAQFSVGDVVNIFGYLDSQDGFLVHAHTMRNVSIRQQHVSLHGTIRNIDAKAQAFNLVRPDGPNSDAIGVWRIQATGATRIFLRGNGCSANQGDINGREDDDESPTVANPEICNGVLLGSFDDLEAGMKVTVRGVRGNGVTTAELIREGTVLGPPIPLSVNEGSEEDPVVRKPTRKTASQNRPDAEGIREKINELQSRVNDILERLSEIAE